jgi:protein-tyrosine phosphatase
MIPVDNNLFRSPRPHLQDLIDNKIEMIIDLESGAYEALHDDAYENAELPGLGIRRYNIPMSDIFPPTHEQVIEALHLISYGRRTLIHCLSGVDRTGFTCAAYRMMEMGWSYEESVKEFRAMGRHWWFGWWDRKLKVYAP